jgi:formamidopyrimidine-DNA glycosylase
MVFHLMIAGRLHWHAKAPKTSKRVLAVLEFSGVPLSAMGAKGGALSLTEAGSKRRAALHLVGSEIELRAMDPGGLEVLTAGLTEFHAALTARNHTLKRALTDPHILSGIGNAYSDEILHRAKLSPIALTSKLTEAQLETLFTAVKATLEEWTAKWIAEAGDKFPEHVTAFREDMAVHGRYGLPCPRCGEKVQRIRYADNETNYCPACQTGGRLLADRGLSRLLKEDWPRSLEEMEERLGR